MEQIIGSLLMAMLIGAMLWVLFEYAPWRAASGINREMREMQEWTEESQREYEQEQIQRMEEFEELERRMMHLHDLYRAHINMHLKEGGKRDGKNDC